LGGNWGCWVDTKTQWGHCQATLRKNWNKITTRKQ
jgi:hypothetical protein